MPKQASIQELKQLPSVGETTAKVLQEKGYGSFVDIIRADPLDLHNECDIVLSSATHIISAAVDQLDGSCPRCSNDDVINQWEEYGESIPDDDKIEVACDSCGWYGNIDELK